MTESSPAEPPASIPTDDPVDDLTPPSVGAESVSTDQNSTDQNSTDQTSTDPNSTEPETDAPAIVAVCITDDVGGDFDTCLESLVAQNYPNLSILVIDAGHPEPIVDRVAAIAPDAYLHRLQGTPGFAAAANQALTLVQDATFLLFCRDDVELHERTVTAMAEEMFRSNAGIVTPKLVEWDDPRRLVSVGMGADQFGVKVDLVEPREFDQEQHDGVRDVFVAPAGVQLIRRDLFTTLGGFDPSMGSENEDLDFCWRAHVAGARIVVSPGTAVRRRTPESDTHPSRHLLRNRLRSLLVTGSRWTLARALPVALLLLVAEAIVMLFSGKRRRAVSVLGIVPATLSDLSDIRERRAKLEAVRQIPDQEVRALQVGGSARLSEYFRHRFGAGQDRLAGLVGSVRDNLGGDELTAQRVAALGGLLLMLLGLFGSRGLISEGVAPIGQIPVLPGAGDLLGEWWNGWRSAGTGQEAAAPLAFLVLGLLRVLFFWGTGVLDTLLVVGPLIAGAIGAWKLATPLGSPRAAIAAATAYACNPVPLAIIGAGRWPTLVVWGAAPFIVASALRLQGAKPFVSAHPLSVRLLRFGLLVAAVATFAPMVIALALVVLAALALASIVIARPGGLRPLALGAPVAVLVPAALHLPFSWHVITGGSWEWLFGPASANASFDSMADLLRFAPGLEGPGVLIVGLLVLAFGSLIIAKGVRFDAAARGLTLAVVAWVLAWAARRGFSNLDLPAADGLLCLAAVGLALAVGAGVRSLEAHGASTRRSRRLVMQSIAGLGMTLIVLLGFQSTFDGRWNLGSQSHIGFAQLLLDNEPDPVRTLWIGAAEVLPVDGQNSAGGIHFGISEGRDLDIINRFAPASTELDAQVGDRLDLVVAGQTDQLGRLVAAYGIDLVIVVPTLAPPPYGGPSYPAGNGIESVLQRQLDLQRVNGTLGLRVYRNTASSGPVLVANDVPARAVGAQLATEVSGNERLGLSYDRTGEWAAALPSPASGELAPAVDGYILIDGDGWEPSNDATTIVSSTDHFVQVRAAAGEQASISFVTSTLSRFVLLLQLVAITGGFIFAQPDRERVGSTIGRSNDAQGPELPSDDEVSA